MKKIALTFSMVAVCMFLMSFVMQPSSKDVNVNNNWKAGTTETLYNSEYEITLTLYSNGYVSIKSATGPNGGSYEIDYNNRIVFEWEEGGTERGFVTTVNTTKGKRIKTVVCKGITFENTERFVVRR